MKILSINVTYFYQKKPTPPEKNTLKKPSLIKVKGVTKYDYPWSLVTACDYESLSNILFWLSFFAYPNIVVYL